jgi:hypothetical protein
MRKELYPENWDELRAACLERAGYQCEYTDPATGRRCKTKDQMIRRSKRTGRRWIVSLYASHLKNDNPGDPNPELLCLCPSHHMKLDRNTELKERLSQRRRGYQLTTTNALIQAVSHYGIVIAETSAGYCWTLATTGISGEKTTALDALCAALREMQNDHHYSQEKVQ